MTTISKIKSTQSGIGRQPPFSAEAEEYLLSCCLIDGNDIVAKCVEAGLSSVAFYLPANRVLFARILDLYNRGHGIELAVVAEDLKSTGELDQVGGYAYLMQVSQCIPTTAQAPLFIEKLLDLHKRRELIKAASIAVESAYGTGDTIANVSAGLRAHIDDSGHTDVTRPRSIASFQVPPDKDSTVLLGNRYLNRGDGALLVSTSGMGKSSITIQAAVTWSIGKPFFGIIPNGPLRSLIVQAEDSDGDVGEVWVSVNASLGLDGPQTEQASKNVMVVTERVRRGEAFVGALRKWIRDFKPDLVWINPLLAFLDGDVNEAKDTGKFLREGLNGLNEPATFAYIVVHHTTKPPTGKNKGPGRAWNEVMYDMAGSADLTNWARAILSLRPAPIEGAFELVLAKRGRRAGVTREVDHGMGKRLETVTTISLKHAEGSITVPGRSRPMPRIFWEYREPDPVEEKEPSKTGRPCKHSFSTYASVFPEDAAQGLGFRQLHRAAISVKPIPQTAFWELVDEALKLNLISREIGKDKQARYFRPIP